MKKSSKSAESVITAEIDDTSATKPVKAAKPAKESKKAKSPKAAKAKDSAKASKLEAPVPVQAPEPIDPLGKLYARVDKARGGNPEKSYTAKLFSRGRAKMAQKLGEEAVDTTIELVKGDRKGVICESADLLYHLMVCWADAGITPDDVWAELQRRQGISGLVEKASRKPD
jgi:phosphoribosyl-ATP pyrophosphohydrolase